MSQHSWTRKPQAVETVTNGNIGINADKNASQTIDGATPQSSFSNPTVPPNEGSKRYTMGEVFKVWYENKDRILNSVIDLPVKSNENYKLSRPDQIYHLDLQPSLNSNETGDKSELTKSLEELTTNDVAGEVEESSKPTQGPPPGMNPISQDSYQTSQASALVTSDKIEWFYIDPTGNEQGPFIGDMMQEWLTDGYLNLDLKIRRKEEVNYQTLKDLCEKVNNYIQPFKVSLPDLSVLSNISQTLPLQDQSLPSFSNQPQAQQQSHFHQFLSSGTGTLGAANLRLNSSIKQQSNLFGNDFIKSDPFSTPLTPSGSASFSNATASQFGLDSINPSLGFNNLQHINTMPSLLQQQIQQQQQPVLSRTNSGWGIDPSNGLMCSNPGTPVSVAPVLPSQISQPTPMSPWLSGVQSSSRVNSPFIPTSSLNNNTNTTDKPNDQSNGPNSVDDHVLDEIHTSVVTDILSDGEEEPYKDVAVEKTKSDNILEQSVSTSKDFFQAQVLLQPSQQAKEKLKEVPKDQPREQPKEQKKEQESKQQLKETVDPSLPNVETLRPAIPSQQKLAPWASSANIDHDSVAKPALTLKEIQLLEAEKLEKQKQVQSELKGDQISNVWGEEKLNEKPNLSKALSWATNAKPTVAKKTLAEIQKEETEAAKIKVVKTSSNGSNAKATFANTLSNSIPKDEGTWTTVAPKKPPVKKAVQPIITSSSSASKANPQLLRSVSASRPVNPTMNATALREEFLIWARASMTNLYPTVSKDDLLDIFITLPLNSSESSQLIAETVYSSSATMDGRRFAQEFLKRRSKVEQQIGSGDSSSWSSAIISSADKIPTVDEDGWSTSVKSKKKGRKY